ncbi:MAG TPA: serine/threonine-protein kinase [Anaerolineae bacterium]|nr:serine/threonine-protein kinase [Anaerolineae bacterium]
MELPTGHILHDRFRIIRLLGKGGMGAVYYAHDPVLNRYVAIKQLAPALPTDAYAAEQLRKQFLREAQTLASLHHPNLPRVTDYFIDHDLHYLIMDYIEGQSLLDMLLVNQQGFAEDLVLEWADQLLSALEYIHANNVIHRDVKPANIRRTTDGRIFLVDFGLVKPYSLNDPHTMTMFHGIGTPEYAPPEQYDPGVHTDQRSDIYALGATMYHLLTGQAPISVTRRTVEPSAFRPPRQAKAEISPALEQVILRAMEIERAKRFASAADMRAALNLIRQPYLVDATRTTILTAAAAAVPASPLRPDRRRRTLLFIGVPLLLFLGIAVGVALQASTASVTSASTLTPTTTPLLRTTTTSTSPSTATATDTPTSTPTISATGTITIVVTGQVSVTPFATGQSGGTTPPHSSGGATPTLPAPTKVRVTPPGQIKPTKEPPGQAKPTKAPKNNSGNSGGNTGNAKSTKAPKN